MISIETTEAAPSAQTIASNVDLLNQILLRLPPKSLLKFKCVSKQWQSLISSPTFSRCRKSHVNSPCGLVVVYLSRKTNSFKYEFVSLHSSHSEAPFNYLSFVDGHGLNMIRQLCNGLLLCVSSHKSSRDEIYYVCNPTTKQCAQLPPLESPRSVVVGVNFAFDPSKSPHYKVVCVRCNFDPGELVFEIVIYSSEERRWMNSTAGPFSHSGDIIFTDGVFCNGAIHWLNRSRWGKSFYFDVDGDQLHEMPAPSIPEDRDERRIAYFGESRGHLHLIEIYEPHSTKFNVYEMCEDYSGWKVKYQVDLDAVVTAFPEMVGSNVESGSLHHNISILEIACVSRGKTDKDSFLVLHIPSKSIRVSLDDGTSFQKLCDFDVEAPPDWFKSYQYCWFKSYQYCETLASV